MIGKTNAIGGVSDPVPKIRTVSGSVISISNALALPAVSLVADIDAVQSGSGDPSPDNVRPISGHTAVTVTRCGKNLIDDSKTYVANATAVYVGAESNAYTVDLPAGTYTISVNFSGEHYGMYYREKNDGANRTMWSSGNASPTEKTFTIEEDGTFRFWVYRSTNAGGVDPTKINHVQIELGSATAYEPYNGNTYTIQLGQTVYGGSLDVTNGVLTVDRAIITYNGTESMQTNGQTANTSRFYIAVSGKANGTTNLISNRFSAEITTDTIGRVSGRASSNGIEFFLPASVPQTIQGAKDWFTANPTQICYELATPQTVQLSPTTVQMLLGNNTIWSDSGDTELQYWARR